MLLIKPKELSNHSFFFIAHWDQMSVCGGTPGQNGLATGTLSGPRLAFKIATAFRKKTHEASIGDIGLPHKRLASRRSKNRIHHSTELICLDFTLFWSLRIASHSDTLGAFAKAIPSMGLPERPLGVLC
ncbi:MAG: hypothetical protein DMG54_30875 [Acidobacteria bacterium]|nr:MAG: hypothetical protein DMG54_30875 [Acidobacteriota bacterium]